MVNNNNNNNTSYNNNDTEQTICTCAGYPCRLPVQTSHADQPCRPAVHAGFPFVDDNPRENCHKGGKGDRSAIYRKVRKTRSLKSPNTKTPSS